MSEQGNRYQAMENAFREGTILSEEDGVLTQHLLALSNQPVQNEYVRHRDTIRGMTINSILSQRQLVALDQQNQKTQKLVFRLTWIGLGVGLLGLLIGGGQLWYAYRADVRDAPAMPAPVQPADGR